MSFRLEEKLNISNKNKILFKKWLLENNAEKIYNDRIVSSIYLDTSNFDLYKSSIEGITPKKIIRLRGYDEYTRIKKLNKLELKISSSEGKFKKTSDIKNTNSILKFGLFDKDYGICKPKVIVSFTRSYFKVFEVRVTFDCNIKYIKYTNNVINSSFVKDKSFIAEIKTNNIEYIKYIYEKFPFNKLKFSKYCRAIEHLFVLQMP